MGNNPGDKTAGVKIRSNLCCNMNASPKYRLFLIHDTIFSIMHFVRMVNITEFWKHVSLRYVRGRRNFSWHL